MLFQPLPFQLFPSIFSLIGFFQYKPLLSLVLRLSATQSLLHDMDQSVFYARSYLLERVLQFHSRLLYRQYLHRCWMRHKRGLVFWRSSHKGSLSSSIRTCLDRTCNQMQPLSKLVVSMKCYTATIVLVSVKSRSPLTENVRDLGTRLATTKPYNLARRNWRMRIQSVKCTCASFRRPSYVELEKISCQRAFPRSPHHPSFDYLLSP